MNDKNKEYGLKDLININAIKTKKMMLKMDIGLLDKIIAFVYSSSKLRTRKVLTNIQKLFSLIDEKVFETNEELKARDMVIRYSLIAILEEGIEAGAMIKQYCKDTITSTNPLVEWVVDNVCGVEKITYEESKFLIASIEDKLQFGYVITLKDIFKKILDKIDEGDFKTYKKVRDDLYNIAAAIINIKREVNSIDSSSRFSLVNDIFENIVTDSVNKLKDKNRVFLTGIKRLNTILAPGYMSKRLYTYLAFPGGGKSQILLKAALDIKKYNNVEPKDPSKRPTVLMITMENDIDETVERIFNMTVMSDDIRNFTPKQVIRHLKKEGNLTLETDNDIDIMIMYLPNRSIDTNDLYSIIKDLNDGGAEVIALILDYLKRIKPFEKGLTEKEELKNITNELKTLAKILDIPVITAQQLNRTASSVVDAALQNRKSDVTRLVGKDGVAGAWEIIENSDVVIVINQEIKYDTNELFLTFKLLKRRYRSSETRKELRSLDYFNHPYEEENTIRLIDDIYMKKSVSLLSLSSTLMSYEDAKKKFDREKKEDTKIKNTEDMEFEPFEYDDDFDDFNEFHDDDAA